MILKILRRIVLAVVFVVLYLVSTVPVGLFLYSLKSDILGINIFTKTGFHAYMQCLQEQAYKIEVLQKSQSHRKKLIYWKSKNAAETSNTTSKIND